MGLKRTVQIKFCVTEEERALILEKMNRYFRFVSNVAASAKLNCSMYLIVFMSIFIFRKGTSASLKSAMYPS